MVNFKEKAEHQRKRRHNSIGKDRPRAIIYDRKEQFMLLQKFHDDV